MSLFLLALGAILSGSIAFGQDCSVFNQQLSEQNPVYASDQTQHYGNTAADPNLSVHWWQAGGNGSCTYTGSAGSACSVSCTANIWHQTGDYGGIYLPAFIHNVVAADQTGAGSAAAGGSVACGAMSGVSTRSCLAITSCAVNVGVSGGVNGIGASISFDTSSIWNNAHAYVAACPAHTASGGPNGSTCVTGPPGGCGLYGYWDPSTCACYYEQSNPSPILIDTDGSGFHLTNAHDGVVFDFFGDGNPIRISWTAANSTNGWLALDRNGNGRIDSARELFGNVTEQPQSSDPNGFLALAVFDRVDYGGNTNGVIDPGDAVWSKLRVWIDSNHDGVSQPEELHTLDEIGIHSISLRYTRSAYVDPNGNRFRYRGSLNPDRHDSVGRIIYDVILTSLGPAAH